MRSQNTNDLILLADSQKNRFGLSKAVRDSVVVVIEPAQGKNPPKPVAAIDVTLLREKLKALDVEIVLDPKGNEFKNVVQLELQHKGEVLAAGTSKDENDALLHALLGFVRERNIDALVASGMTKADAVRKSIGGSVAV